MGCSGVIFEASQHNLPENVALTKKAVSMTVSNGVIVVGQFANLDSGEMTVSATVKSTSAIYDKHYVERIGVACLTVSVRRMERGSAKHDLARLVKINQKLGIQLGNMVAEICPTNNFVA